MICVGSIIDIEEGTSKGFDVEDAYFFVVKRDNTVYLYRNSCPHLGTPLEWEEDKFLDPDGSMIICSTHGALFEIETGRCLAGPCKGQYLQAVDYVLENGLLMIEKHQLGRGSR